MTLQSLPSWTLTLQAALTAGLVAVLPAHTNAQPQDSATVQPQVDPDPLPPPHTSDPEALALAALPEAIISHRDGRQIRGEILEEDPFRLILCLDGIRTEVLRTDINSIRRMPPALERYESVRVSIPRQDLDSRLALIDWLVHRNLYAQALAEVRVVLDVDPAHAAGTRLKVWLEAQLKMRRTSSKHPDGSTSHATSLDVIRARGNRKTPQADLPVLTPEQVNRIRVYEVDLSNPPRIIVTRDTIKKLFQNYGTQPGMPQTRSGREALTRRPGHEILDLMFKLRARELYPEVRVLEDPASLKYFRERIHGRGGWLINSCGSVRCHGGTESGPFQLVTKRSHSTEAVYTNFYTLDTFKLSDGTPLIDYDEPNQSPLLQMATRRSNSTRPHPETGAIRGPRAWKPIFSSSDDPKFRKVADWIRTLYRPRPDYGIDFPPAPKPPANPPPDEAQSPLPTPTETGQTKASTDESAGSSENDEQSHADPKNPGNPPPTPDG